MGKLFGTDGVRGIANTQLTAELAYQLGRAGAFVLTEETNHKPKVLIGKDTRVSGDMLECALAAGLCSVGAEAVIVGVAPTPAIAYLTRLYEADAGVVISASHNPAEYNGIKFFNSQGYKLSDEIEDRIESIILENAEEIPVPTGGDLGHVTYCGTGLSDYIAFAKSTVPLGLSGLKIAIDCANGASSATAQRALEDLGATVFTFNNTPDGVNINAGCGSTHIEQIRKFTVESGADVGLAFDGDADRVLAVDEAGELIDGDKIIAIIANHLKNQGKLTDDTVVMTVMSNLGFFIMAENSGMKAIQTKVGDRYVLEEMVKGGYAIGGEQSGHVILLEHNTTGDGLVTALQLLTVMTSTNKRLSELATIMEVLPQVLINAKTSNKDAYLKDAEIMAEIAKIEKELDGKGRVLIRPSGTEPLVRVMIEGKDIEAITKSAEFLAELIRKA